MEMRFVVEEDGEECKTLTLGEEKIRVAREVLISDEDVEGARAMKDANLKGWAVAVRFTEKAGKRLRAATKANLRKRLAIIVDGKAVSAPMIMAAISRDAHITGNFTKEEAGKLAARLVKGKGG